MRRSTRSKQNAEGELRLGLNGERLSIRTNGTKGEEHKGHKGHKGHKT
jgi:hypothetical protein